jgi:hypothetical protein
VASAAYLFALPFWLPPLLVDLDGADLFVRVGFCILILAPAGFLMGFGFPTGMRLVSAISTGPTPWFWGINGAAGVLAASVAVVTSIAFSIDTTLRVGAACYLLIAAPAVLLVFAGARPQRHRSTIPAPKHKDAKGRPYDPAVIAHMDSHRCRRAKRFCRSKFGQGSRNR